MTIPSEHPHERLPGCGLAAYAGLLLFIAGVGAVGMTISWYSLVAGGDALSPQRVSYGGVVDPAVLAPLREAGLLTADEIPDAFHAEVPDGSAACAIVADRLVRLSADGGRQTLPLASITEVTGDESTVRVIGNEATIICVFHPGEGAGSFKAMLQSR